LLTPRCRGNGIIRGTIGDALECVCDARQLEGDLVGTGRPFQHDDSFSAGGKSRPEQQAGHDGRKHHQRVVTRYGDASTCDANQVVREVIEFVPPRSTTLRGGDVWTAIAYC
jgi:hypothetical protein